jgi:HlyD family secretion protein
MPKQTVPLPISPTTNTPQANPTKKENSDRAVTELPNQASDRLSSANAKSKSESHWSPALQNVLEQPPATFPRQLLIGGLIFCLAFIGWAWLGKIEEVGHARGRLVPRGEAYKVNPLDLGKIMRINVREGDTVQAGQVLVEMDTQIATSEVDRLKQMLAAYQDQLKQKQALIEKTRQEANTRSVLAKTNLEIQSALIDAAKSKAATSEELLAQMKTEKAASQTRVQRLKPLTGVTKERLAQLKSDVAAHQERVNRLKKLIAYGALSKEYLFQAQQDLRASQAAITQTKLQESANTDDRLFEAQRTERDRTSTVTQQQGELKQALVEIQSLQAQLNQKIAESNINQLEAQQRIQQLEVEKTQLKSQIAETQNLLNRARTQLVQKFLYAPVDGIVSSLNVRNAGEVVQQGQTIAEVAPTTAPLVLSASLPNQEAGFIKPGMPVQIKLDAFPYQDFGVVMGKVTSISSDSKQVEGQGLVYKVEVALDRNYINANQQTIQFKAGQTATADIIIRRRRIADVLLAPLKQLQKGGIDL